MLEHQPTPMDMDLAESLFRVAHPNRSINVDASANRNKHFQSGYAVGLTEKCGGDGWQAAWKDEYENGPLEEWKEWKTGFWAAQWTAIATRLHHTEQIEEI